MLMVHKLRHNMPLERRLPHNMPQARKPLHNMLLERKLLHNMPQAHKPPERKMPRTHRMMQHRPCLLYTSPSPRDRTRSRMPSSA